MKSSYHFVSAPEYVAVHAEKELLFGEREKEVRWTRNELKIAETETQIFLRFGWNILKQMNFGIKMCQMFEQHDTVH